MLHDGIQNIDGPRRVAVCNLFARLVDTVMGGPA